jgi:hypothetical protein
MMDEEEREAEVKRLTEELENEHAREADRKAAEIMQKLDIQKLNAGINNAVNPTSLEAAHNMQYNYKSQEFTMPRNNMRLHLPKPDYNITFHNTIDGKQEKIGRLDFNGATLKFEGNADQSAMVFITSLADNFRGRLNDEHLAAAKLLAEFVTFELSEEMEIDDAYRKGFNDAIYAVRGILSKKIKEMENKP